MELSQSSCSFGTEGKKTTHDFLSLYNNHSSFQHQDPRPSQESLENLGKWSSAQSLSPNPYIRPNNFNSLPSSKAMSLKNQSFMEMMKPAKSYHEDDDDDEEFLGKRDISSQKELTMKVDSKNNNQKANTPRSKHSATEQRRRSKINDRFQILREIIPFNDQKRDKASFLLEVIEYIQFLQEKVTTYGGPYQGWNQEPTKLMPWRNRNGIGENMADHSRVIKNAPGPGMIFGGKLNDPNMPMSPSMVANAQNIVENDLTPGVSYKPMEPHLGRANKAFPLPVPIRPELFIPAGRSGDLAQPIQRPTADEQNLATGAESHLRQTRPCAVATDVLEEMDEMAIEGGTISISNVYSQGLLNNLTKALQSSGVDLTEASISVQIDLGKQRLTTSKDHTNPSPSNQTSSRSRNLSCGEDLDQARKRLKIENS